MEMSVASLGEFRRLAREGFDRLMHTLEALPLEAFAEPCILPGWSRAHCATHIARNADSHVRLLNAAREGRVVEQYAGGKEGRAADIEEGSTREPPAIVNDVRTSGEALFSVWDSLSDDVWLRNVVTNRGEKQAWRVVWSREREIEIHHVDLDASYKPADWPAGFVDTMLVGAVRSLSARLEPGTKIILKSNDWSAEAGEGAPCTISGTRAGILAWILGRDSVADVRIDGAMPFLKPWG